MEEEKRIQEEFEKKKEDFMKDKVVKEKSIDELLKELTVNEEVNESKPNNTNKKKKKKTKK